jgi:hypothetical protein
MQKKQSAGTAAKGSSADPWERESVIIGIRPCLAHTAGPFDSPLIVAGIGRGWQDWKWDMCRHRWNRRRSGPSEAHSDEENNIKNAVQIHGVLCGMKQILWSEFRATSSGDFGGVSQVSPKAGPLVDVHIGGAGDCWPSPGCGQAGRDRASAPRFPHEDARTLIEIGVRSYVDIPRRSLQRC